MTKSKQTSKKIISLLIVMVMMFSVMPMAFAQDVAVSENGLIAIAEDMVTNEMLAELEAGWQEQFDVDEFYSTRATQNRWDFYHLVATPCYMNPATGKIEYGDDEVHNLAGSWMPGITRKDQDTMYLYHFLTRESNIGVSNQRAELGGNFNEANGLMYVGEQLSGGYTYREFAYFGWDSTVTLTWKIPSGITVMEKLTCS